MDAIIGQRRSEAFSCLADFSVIELQAITDAWRQLLSVLT